MPSRPVTRQDDKRLNPSPDGAKRGPKPKDNTVKRVLISIEPALLAEFDQAGGNLGLTRSEFFRNAASMYMQANAMNETPGLPTPEETRQMVENLEIG